MTILKKKQIASIFHVGIPDFGYNTVSNELRIGQFEIRPNFPFRIKMYREDYFQNLKVFNASNNWDASSNFIGQLNGSVFDRFSNLKYLNLNRNNLKRFDFIDFHNRLNLKVFDRINFTPFVESVKNLEIFNLIGNQSDELDFVAPSNFPKLFSLGLSENPFTCEYLKEFLRQWPNLQLFNINSLDQRNERGINCQHKPPLNVILM